MHADPSSLDAKTLAACLRATAGEERERQVDFLRYLDPFDARRSYLEAGYGSLWQFCLRELALREGAAGRRIGAMRVLREFPALEAPLRDGRLSLTTVVTLRPVLTKETLEEMVARAAFKTDEETRHLVATLLPRPEPKEGIRRLPVPPRARPAGRAVIDPISADQWSVRITIDGSLKEEIETLRCLLSHKISDGNLASVLREAVRCGIEKHGKRRGAVRKRKPAGPEHDGDRPPAPVRREPVPPEVRRAVYERDGGRCTYVSLDGRRCDSRWQLEIDHVEAAALGGPSTAENTRLRCRPHNGLHAEKTFGREHMARFTRVSRRTPRTGESTIAGDSGPGMGPAPTDAVT